MAMKTLNGKYNAALSQKKVDDKQSSPMFTKTLSALSDGSDKPEPVESVLFTEDVSREQVQGEAATHQSEGIEGFDGLKIKAVRPLSANEAESLDRSELKTTGYYWLLPYDDGTLAFSQDDGLIWAREGMGNADLRFDSTFGVRPVLEVEGLESVSAENKLEIAGHMYTKISDTAVFCDDIVGHAPFLENGTASDVGSYETSNLKSYVDRWAQLNGLEPGQTVQYNELEKQQSEDKNTQKRTSVKDPDSRYYKPIATDHGVFWAHNWDRYTKDMDRQNYEEEGGLSGRINRITGFRTTIFHEKETASEFNKAVLDMARDVQAKTYDPDVRMSFESAVRNEANYLQTEKGFGEKGVRDFIHDRMQDVLYKTREGKGLNIERYARNDENRPSGYKSEVESRLGCHAYYVVSNCCAVAKRDAKPKVEYESVKKAMSAGNRFLKSESQQETNVEFM